MRSRVTRVHAVAGSRLAGLVGLGQVGVGVDEVAGLAVVGEEGEHRLGALAAAGHVVGLQGHVVAVVHDRVEVQVEVGPGGLPGADHRRAERGEQALVVAAGEPVGVGAQRGRLGQGFQAGEGGQGGVGGAGEVGGADRAGQVEGDQAGHQQQEPGEVGGQAQRLGWPGDAAGAGWVIAARAASLAGGPGGQPLVALLGEQLPHPGAVQRRGGGQRLGDLGDRVPGRS